jgi:hypothetical protein
MPNDERSENIYPCPKCGSTAPADRKTEDYILEDGTKRRMTFCTACVREDADGTLRYEVITEEFIRTEIDRKMHDNSRSE